MINGRLVATFARLREFDVPVLGSPRSAASLVRCAMVFRWIQRFNVSRGDLISHLPGPDLACPIPGARWVRPEMPPKSLCSQIKLESHEEFPRSVPAYPLARSSKEETPPIRLFV